jgi:hypothetical protein
MRRDHGHRRGRKQGEHYEIASYGTLAYFAELLGNDRAKELLGQTLDEEKAADEKLNEIAKSDVNRQALTGEGEDEEEGALVRVGRAARRGASAMGFANDKGRASRGSRKSGSQRRR